MTESNLKASIFASISSVDNFGKFKVAKMHGSWIDQAGNDNSGLILRKIAEQSSSLWQISRSVSGVSFIIFISFFL